MIQDLQESRRQIDEIDREIVELFCRRMKVVQEVTAYKQAHHLPVLQQNREQEVLNQVAKLAGEPLGDGAKMLFTTIMDVSKSLQHTALQQTADFRQFLEDSITRSFPLPEEGSAKVACQGVPGAYSQKACHALFEQPDISFFPSFDQVFQAVEDGSCAYGILPIENSSAGSVTAVYDLMKKHHFFIRKEVKIRIAHALLCKPGVSLEEITHVYSHEQGILQCQEFLSRHPQIQVHVYSNTAAAAKYAATCPERGAAAIASDSCAELYGLKILQNGIQDCQSNFTRFICISKDLVVPKNADKVSLSLTLPHTAGSLYRVISRFAANGLNLTKLESRPIPETDFEFLFYFDFEGSIRSAKVRDLLCSLKAELPHLEFLGNYQEKLS